MEMPEHEHWAWAWRRPEADAGSAAELAANVNRGLRSSSCSPDELEVEASSSQWSSPLGERIAGLMIGGAVSSLGHEHARCFDAEEASHADDMQFAEQYRDVDWKERDDDDDDDDVDDDDDDDVDSEQDICKQDAPACERAASESPPRPGGDEEDAEYRFTRSLVAAAMDEEDDSSSICVSSASSECLPSI